MHQGGGLKRLDGLLLRDPLRCQFAQLVVDQRQQPAGRVRIALTQGAQELRHLAHQAQIITAGKKARQQVACRPLVAS